MTPEIEAIFEEAAADEDHPLGVAMNLLLRELQEVAPRTKDDKALIFHAKRRRLRSAITRAFIKLTRDDTVSYEAQLAMVRQLLIALCDIDTGKRGGIL